MLGLSDREFYDLIPRQYGLLLERHLDRQKHAEWLTGVIASTIANFSMGAPEEPLQPKHFALPLLQVREKRKRLNRARIADQIRQQFDSYKERKIATPS